MSKYKPKTLCKNCDNLDMEYGNFCLAVKLEPDYCVVTGKNLNAGHYACCVDVNPAVVPCHLFKKV